MHAEAPDGYSKMRPESDAKMARVGVADVSGPSPELAASSRLPRPRAILFDWDNTLVDSWVTIHEALNITMAAMGRPLWSIEQTKERVRLSLRESFPRHFGERWEEARRIYLDKFSAIHLDRLTALPGRDELLEGLAGEGMYMGVVSNKTGALLRREADELGWSARFGAIIGAGDAGRGIGAMRSTPRPVRLFHPVSPYPGLVNQQGGPIFTRKPVSFIRVLAGLAMSWPVRLQEVLGEYP